MTRLGPGSFSAPVNVTVEGDSTASDATGAILIGSAITVVICFLATVAILLVVYILW